MGDDMDFGYDCPNSSYSSSCSYSRSVRDCDGDIITTCLSGGSCPYKRVVRDCDGDYIELCSK